MGQGIPTTEELRALGLDGAVDTLQAQNAALRAEVGRLRPLAYRCEAHEGDVAGCPCCDEAEVKRLRAGLEMIRDREALEPSDYIAAYGEPIGSPGDLARTVLEGDK